MADYAAIAQQFVTFYYGKFDENRQQLASLYRDHSMLTFEGQPFQGSESITKKLTSLPFQKVQHRVTTMDAQPASINGADIIVSVTGLLVVDDSQNPLQFSQTFRLVPDGNTYYVYEKISPRMYTKRSHLNRFNDIFRLNYG
ncbi:nuclear transport factor 2 [Phlebopus sp. FC_14]|nr:nuclear transport factor 2 [Phlebopus sp. FC_14]